MTAPFGRIISLVLRDKANTQAAIEVDADTLNIGFTVERNLDLEPSSALITIHNLSKATQESLSTASEGWEVVLSAGYKNNVDAIFTGDVRFVRHRREPPLLATDIEAGDGDTASQKYITKHFPARTTIGTVFRFLQEQSDLGPGNVERIAQINQPDGLPNRLENGLTVRGYAVDEMNDLAKSRGAIFSMQNGEVVVLRPGESLPGAQKVVISPSTGMIGYPWVDNEGILTVNHRLTPDIFPGCQLELRDVFDDYVTGTYVVERAVYSGSLYGDDFNVEVEGRSVLP